MTTFLVPAYSCALPSAAFDTRETIRGFVGVYFCQTRGELSSHTEGETEKADKLLTEVCPSHLKADVAAVETGHERLPCQMRHRH